MGGGAHLRAGIVGAGFIGAVHARSAVLAGARVVGVAASSVASASAAAPRLRSERAFESAAALVTAGDVDVVHICTPNHLHVPLARAALEAGKHVICEKPLALDHESASELVELAAARDLRGAVPFVYRCYPMVREARERLRGGGAGDLRLIHGTYLQDWLSRPGDDNWRVDRALGGPSRAFADIGSHWTDLAEFVSEQRIVRLAARTTTVMADRNRAEGRATFERGDGTGPARPVDTEDAALVQFETDRGALGSVVVSQVSPGRKNRLWIEFDGAMLVQRDRDLLAPAAARLATLPAGHPQGYADCFDAFVADVYGAIRGEGEPEGVPRFADGLRAVRITEAVLASAAAAGAWTDVPATELAESPSRSSAS